jgi:hypothetical protein
MLRNKLVRSDGSVIDSSVIISCEYTEEVNSSTNLSVGDVTASEIAVEILSTDAIQQDDVITYYVIEDGVETKIGVFNAEKPTVATRTSMRFTAYDNIAKSEKNFSGWLRENQSLFPMTLFALVQYACSYCGLTLATTDFPHTGLSVNAFYADNITCRQILNWAGSIAGRFIRANANGEVEFAWYGATSDFTILPHKSTDVGTTVSVVDDGKGNLSITSDDIEVIDDGAGNVTIKSKDVAILTDESGIVFASGKSFPYFQGSLTYENYSTDLIERVQVNHSEDDVGVIYPTEVSGNCFTISENMILGVTSTDIVSQIAAGLYSQLKDISYVPCSVTIPRTARIRAGDIINVTDSNGHAFVSYVMKVVIAAGGTSLTSTGDKSYESNAAVASEKYSNLTGKLLTIKKSVDGLELKHADLDGRLAAIKVDVDSIDSFVGGKIEDAINDYDLRVGTKLSQTEAGWEYKFGEVTGDVSGLSEEVQRQLEERKAYIRFEDGNIYLGRASSEIMLILKNNRISFVQNTVGYPELAYISNNILYITEGEFLTQLRIGKFGFTPGANGNLSFKKVVS